VGGGLPAAAYGGPARIMDQVAPSGPIYQAGTLSGNPLAMAAGLATLRLLRDESPYDRLECLASRLADGLDRAAVDAGLPHVVQRVGSMLTLFFRPGPVRDYADAKGSDTARFGRFFRAMLARGIYLPCSQFEAAFVSLAHTDEDLAAVAEACRSAMEKAR
ncbi:MAG: aminotransferase class III-fold pyridoxal phosphate-dependent enzyme, partial [Candidatus Rokuibacteriota bacterium]